MFLSNVDIERKKNEIFPIKGHFDPKCLSEASYDLRVGDEAFLSEDRVPTRLGKDSPFVILAPGQFALVKTYEAIKIPRELIGLLSVKSKFKFQGLINISGFHVDPTYEGNLIFAVQNVGPNDIRLKFGESVFMIMFAELKTSYSGQPRKPGYSAIPLDQMAQLGGPSVTLVQLKNDLDRMSHSLKIYGALAIAIFVAVITILLKFGR
jgi:dCTP deaminase